MTKPENYYGPTCRVFQLSDPADLAILISSGLIWRGGPKTQRLAIRALKSGAVPRPANLPPQVAAFLDRV